MANSKDKMDIWVEKMINDATSTVKNTFGNIIWSDNELKTVLEYYNKFGKPARKAAREWAKSKHNIHNRSVTGIQHKIYELKPQREPTSDTSNKFCSNCEKLNDELNDYVDIMKRLSLENKDMKLRLSIIDQQKMAKERQEEEQRRRDTVRGL